MSGQDAITLDDHTWFREDLHRAAITRALTAQAWAVACACMLCAKPKPPYLAAVLAALPTPADLAADILGGEP